MNNKADGVYACRLCGLPLFAAKAKFESGTGWPSFTTPFDADHVSAIVDRSHGMTRTEPAAPGAIPTRPRLPRRPPPDRLRYCINSVSLQFVPASDPLPTRSTGGKLASITRPKTTPAA